MLRLLVLYVLTIVRGVETAGSGQAHSAGAAVRHMAIGRDFREANLHIEATTAYNDGTGTHTLHGIASGEGDVVGTDKAQTLHRRPLQVQPSMVEQLIVLQLQGFLLLLLVAMLLTRLT
jgi:hypothetical protein